MNYYRNRRAELAGLLRGHLSEDTVGFSDVERLRWLFEHLDEYLDRWKAFWDRDSLSVSRERPSDGHTLLLVAAEVIEEQLLAIEDKELRALWHEFVECLNSVDSNSDKHIGEEMQARLDRVRGVLARQS